MSANDDAERFLAAVGPEYGTAALHALGYRRIGERWLWVDEDEDGSSPAGAEARREWNDEGATPC